MFIYTGLCFLTYSFSLTPSLLVNKSTDSDESTPLPEGVELSSALSSEERGDPVLIGVSQMLSILKQHVTKPKLK